MGFKVTRTHRVAFQTVCERKVEVPRVGGGDAGENRKRRPCSNLALPNRVFPLPSVTSWESSSFFFRVGLANRRAPRVL